MTRIFARSVLCSAIGVVSILFAASPALAKETHAFDLSFGEAGSGNGQLTLSGRSGVAANESTGDVYVADTENGRVQEFTKTGNFLRTFAHVGSPTFVAVDNAAGGEGDVYVADLATESVAKYTASGSLLQTWGVAGKVAGFHELAGITVDSAGNLFVYDAGSPSGEGRVQRYSRDGVYQAQFETGFGAGRGLAVDNAARIYVVRGSGAVAEFDSEGTLINEELNPSSRGEALDVATGPNEQGVYVAAAGTQHPTIDHYTSSGLLQSTFGYGQLEALAGLAVGSEDYVFATDSSRQQILRFAPVTVPDVTTGEAVGVTSTESKLTGSVNPAGFPVTECVFEYGLSVEYETAIPCSPPAASIGSAAESSEVSAELAGVTPNREYHFRLRASNASGSEAGSDQTFITAEPVTSKPFCGNEGLRIGASSLLPDCRAYEQITPPSSIEKNGNSLSGSESDVIYAAPSGQAASYFAASGALGIESGSQYPIYVANRSPESWSSGNSTIPPAFGTLVVDLAYTENLTGIYEIVTSGTPASGQRATLLLKDFATNRITPIFELAEPPSAQEGLGKNSFKNTAIAGESADGATVLIESEASLAPGALKGRPNLYAWSKATGEIHLASVPPSGLPAEGAYAGPWCWEPEACPYGRESGGVAGKYYVQGAISQDGSRVVYSTTDSKQIYMRINPTDSNARTVEVSASQKVNSAEPTAPADFLEATPSGSFVFFKSHAELTDDANIGSLPEEEDLYRYDSATGELVDLTATAIGSENAQVIGMAGISEDGEYAYFVAGGALAPGAQAEGHNLYIWQEGEPIKLVAKLGDERLERAIWQASRTENGELRSAKTFRVSADGRTVLFTSLTQPGSRLPQVYRWEIGGAGIQCLSCNPTGGPTSSGGYLAFHEGGSIKPNMQLPIITRNLSRNGERAFFSTSASLVRNDVNDVEDVYEWEASGEGSCSTESDNGGCLYLISGGVSPEASYFGDASANGDDVFFFTAQPLVGQDQDELVDEYDARVGGGLAQQSPPAGVSCQGESCLGPPAPPSKSQEPNSASFVGPGNVTPKRCSRGVRRNHKCVRISHRPRRHRYKRHNGPVKGTPSGNGNHRRAHSGGNR